MLFRPGWFLEKRSMKIVRMERAPLTLKRRVQEDPAKWSIGYVVIAATLAAEIPILVASEGEEILGLAVWAETRMEIAVFVQDGGLVEQALRASLERLLPVNVRKPLTD
jgi:hypothetical protein